MKVFITLKPYSMTQSVEPKLIKSLVRAGITIVNKPDEADLILSVGGDGTVLYKVYKYLDCHKPFICINAGSVGALCYLNPDNLDEKIEHLSRIKVEEFSVLEVETENFHDIAIQDVRVERVDHLALKMSISESGKVLANRHNGDGIIIANAVGSSGYNFSAGGPILDIYDRGTVLTPICPIPPDGNFYDSIVESNHYPNIDLEVICEHDSRLVLDDRHHHVQAGTKINIRQSEKTFKLALPPRKH